MHDRQRILALLNRSERGQTLPQPFYTDPDIFQFDVSSIFARSWIWVGLEAELSSPGAHLALTVGRNPVLIVKGRDGVIRAFHNTCRHRGAQICLDGRGQASRLVCPYHKWTYDLQGHLIGAALMPANLDFASRGLKSVALERVAGNLYVGLGSSLPDFRAFRDAVAPFLDPYHLSDTKLAHESVLLEKANWKLVMENARECYHCASAHVELAKCFPVSINRLGTDERDAEYAAKMQRLGLSTAPASDAWWHVARYPLNPGVESISPDGKPVVRRPLIETTETEIGGVRWATEPNAFCHVFRDYCFTFSVFPISAEETIVVSKWFVKKDAREGVDYDLDKLTEVWTKTNLQDRWLAENNQRGVNGLGYSPGTYSTVAEEFVVRFSDWYHGAAHAAALQMSPPMPETTES
jgi:Rieske 2Fe-2S family protein